MTTLFQWLGNLTMVFMMLLIVFAVLMREFYKPIVGDYELVQISMVALIMFGLAYTQSVEGHISIGLIVDRWPRRVQLCIDAFAYTLTFLVCLMISVYNLIGATHAVLTYSKSTDLLGVPFYPFQYIIGIGFLLWGLESLVKVVHSIETLRTDEHEWQDGGEAAHVE